MNIDPVALLRDFRTEVTDHLNTLDEQLLRLERDPSDAQPVRAMFLAAHSIKGGSAMLGIAELRELAHAVEDVLGVLRDQRRPFEHAIADVLFRAVDRLRAILPAVDGTARASTPETQALVAELAGCTTTTLPRRHALSADGAQAAKAAVTSGATYARAGAAATDGTYPPKGPATAEGRHLAEGAVAALEGSGGGARRVLLVEDSPSVRQVETFLLQDAGFVVDSAAGGNEALERAHQVHYVLVIAGVETRELRGPDLVLALRADASGPPVPVLLTTTDHGPSSPSSTDDVVFAPKGRLDNADFVRVVRELTAPVAA